MYKLNTTVPLFVLSALLLIILPYCVYDIATTGWNLTRAFALALSALMILVLWFGGKEKPRVHK